MILIADLIIISWAYFFDNVPLMNSLIGGIPAIILFYLIFWLFDV